MTTTKADILSWALISLAAEPYVVCVLGTYTPIFLEQIARENGVLEKDHSSPCIAISQVVRGTHGDILEYSGELTQETQACVLPMFGGRFYIDTSSYALYTFSLSVLIQTVCVLTINGIADNSNLKKTLIVLFGCLGGLATFFFFYLGNNNYYTASFLAICANISFGCVSVLMNAYLTIMVNNSSCSDTEVQRQELLLEQDNDQVISNSEALGKIGSKISGVGTSTGYIAAMLLQVVFLLLMNYMTENGYDVFWSIKLVISIAGLWWLIWQAPIAIFLKNIESLQTKSMSIKEMVIQGYKELGHVLINIRSLKDIYYYLLAMFVLTDSLTTINSTAILFGKTVLNMPVTSLAKIGVLVMISAIAGSIIIPIVLIGKYGYRVEKVQLLLVLWCLCVPLYGIFALTSAFEMYVLAVWYGLGLGGLSTINRSIFSIIIPEGKENIFFSIYSLTDRTSSIVGPFVVGLIINIFHNVRGAFWILTAFLLISIPILSVKFDLDRARSESFNFGLD